MGDNERKAALLVEIERLLVARGLTADDLIEALEQLPLRQDPEVLRQAFADHRAEVEALAADHGLVGVSVGDDGCLVVLPGGADLPGDVLEDFATVAAAILGRQASARYGSWAPDGPFERVPGDTPISELYERFHVGSHDDSISCRGCRSRFTLDHGSGDWHGRHYRLCPAVPRA